MEVEKNSEMNKESYRSEVDSSDDDSSSTFSLDSDSDCSDSFLHKMQRSVSTPSSKIPNLKTKGELDMQDLPPIQDLKINVKEAEIEKIGFIHGIVDRLVIVRALKNIRPLDIDSVLFLTPQKPLGSVFDVFGPVSEPFYTVRFNSSEHIIDTGVTKGIDVFYAPQNEGITTYVIVDELRKQKGSDASWKDNNEPPEEYIDYSDDEQEKAAKHKRKAKNRAKPFVDETNEDIKIVESPIGNDVLQPRSKKHAPTAVKAFRSMRPNVSNSTRPRTSSLSMRAVMSSDYRPNSSRPQNAFEGPPMFAQSRNPFGAPRSCMPQHGAAPPPIRPPEVAFRHNQPFAGQPHHNVSSGTRPLAFQPPQSLHQSTQRGGFSPMYLQQHADSRPVSAQQYHVFGQIRPLGSMSPVQPPLQHRPVHFAQSLMTPPPSLMSPPPALIPGAIAPPSPNFSYFSHNYSPSPPSPAPGHNFMNASWFQGQSAPRPNMRYMSPMAPLSIQIPSNLRSPPPTIVRNDYNSLPYSPSMQH